MISVKELRPRHVSNFLAYEMGADMTRAIIFSLLTILSASAARADVLTDCTESPQSDVRVAACTQIINDKAAS